MANGALVITAAVEGSLDQAVVQRVVEDMGGALGPVHGRKGKRYLRDKLSGFNNAARFSPWVVLVDLDEDAECAPELRRDWLPQPADRMLFRIAVREVEAWIFGDPDRLSRFLRVQRGRVPTNPEALMDGKRAMVDLGRLSRSRDIQEDMVPSPGSGRTVGSGYSSRLSEFVLDRTDGWRPRVSADACNSLRRLLARLSALAEGR